VFYVVVDVSFETKLLSQVCCEHAAFLILDCCVTIKNCLLLCHPSTFEQHVQEIRNSFFFLFTNTRRGVHAIRSRASFFLHLSKTKSKSKKNVSRVLLCCMCFS